MLWLWPWQDILSRFTESPNPSRGQSREVLHINSSLYCRVGTQRALLILYIKHSDGLMVAQPLKYGRHPSWVLEDRKVGKVDVNALSESWNGNWNSHCFMFSTWVCLCLVLVTMYWKSEGLKHQINYINKQNISAKIYQHSSGQTCSQQHSPIAPPRNWESCCGFVHPKETVFVQVLEANNSIVVVYYYVSILSSDVRCT